MRLSVAAMLLLLSSCAASARYGSSPPGVSPRAASQFARPGPSALIPVLPHSTSLGCRSRVLGVVDVHTPMGEEGALNELRGRAQALGAEAVVSVDFHHGDDDEAEEGGTTHLSGLAVRCEDMLQGRAYDVIARVEATAPMGDEAAGLRALRQQARALQADLIIHVEFEHGESHDQPTRLRGDAIRFRR